jgi:hypothetical protein
MEKDIERAFWGFFKLMWRMFSGTISLIATLMGDNRNIKSNNPPEKYDVFNRSPDDKKSE